MKRLGARRRQIGILIIALLVAGGIVALATSSGSARPPRQLTSTALNCAPSHIAVGSTATCSVTVSDGARRRPTAPIGTVILAAQGVGTFAPSSGCVLTPSGTAATCTSTYTPSGRAGSVTVVAQYPGNRTHLPSRTTGALTVGGRATQASVSCSPASMHVGASTTCKVTVTDVDAGTPQSPTGAIAFVTKAKGQFAPHASCNLTAGKSGAAGCQVRFTPSEAGSAETLSVSYRGDATHTGGHAFTTVTAMRLSPTLTFSCAATQLAIATTTTCTATASGTGGIPLGTVKYSVGDKHGMFTPADSCTLLAATTSSSCHVTFAPSGKPGDRSVTARYEGNKLYTPLRITFKLTAATRSTSMTLACKSAGSKSSKNSSALTCTVTVKDTAAGTATAPTGAVTFTTATGGKFSAPTCTLTASGATGSCIVTFTPARKHPKYTVTASYAGDTLHPSSQTTVNGGH